MHWYTSQSYWIYFICVVFLNGYMWSFWSIPVLVCFWKGDTKCWSKLFPAIAMIVQTLLLRSVTASLQCLSCHDIAELCSQAIVYHVKRKQFVAHFTKDSLFDDIAQYFLQYHWNILMEVDVNGIDSSAVETRKIVPHCSGRYCRGEKLATPTAKKLYWRRMWKWDEWFQCNLDLF